MSRPLVNRAAWFLLSLTPFVVTGALRGVLSETGVIMDVDFRTGLIIFVLTVAAVDVSRWVNATGNLRWVRRTAATRSLRENLAEVDRLLAKYDQERGK